MPDKIKCTVSNCRFWDNEFCRASVIEVNPDEGGIEAPNEAGTKCHTFNTGR